MFIVADTALGARGTASSARKLQLLKLNGESVEMVTILDMNN